MEPEINFGLETTIIITNIQDYIWKSNVENKYIVNGL